MSKMLLWAGLLLLLHVQLGSTYKLVCYYTNWSQYRQEPAKYFPENIDPQLCTHLVYAFATMSEHKIAAYEWNDDVLYKRFNDLKNKNPKLVTLLAIGGWNFGTQKFTDMVASAGNRLIFINSVMDWLRKYNFDGIDLDFEYPGSRGSPPEDKRRFTILIQEMLAEFIQEAKTSGRPRLLITAAVSAGKGTIDAGYEIAQIGKLLDFISVMTYDFHGGWDTLSGHNSPMCKSCTDHGDLQYFNIVYAMNYWRDNGTPAEKLLLGFPSYARTLRNPNPSNCDIGIPVSGAGSPGPYTREAGFWAYYEVCTWLNGATVKWSKEQCVPFACKGNEWVGFDNKESYDCKMKFLMDSGFGGAMVWAIDLDDFLGTFCNEGKYPLISHLKSLLEGAPVNCPKEKCPCIHGPTTPGTGTTTTTTTAKPEGPTEPPVTPPTVPQPTVNPPDNDVDPNFCAGKADGFYVNPLNANKYYQCGREITYPGKCAESLEFQEVCKCCNWPN